jgi:hypothetical protein
MSNNTLIQEEKVLRKICGGAEKEKRHDSDTYHGDDELNDEKRRVNQQELKVTGRSGERK